MDIQVTSISEQVTSISEAERLMNVGVPKWQASMCWKKDSAGNTFSLCANSASNYLTATPAYTLKDIMRIMPQYIVVNDLMFLCFGRDQDEDHWYAYYGDEALMCASADSLIMVLVLACEWLVENGFRLEINSL